MTRFRPLSLFVAILAVFSALVGYLFLCNRSYLGDLDEIRDRGVLRVIGRPGHFSHLPRADEQADLDHRIMGGLAAKLGVSIKWVAPPRYTDMIEWLNTGRGDILSASLTVTPARGERVAFTHPYRYVKELVVVRAGDSTIGEAADLAGRTVHVRASSAYYQTLMDLTARHGGIEVVPVPEDVETEEIIARVGEGMYEITLADSDVVETILTYRDDVRVACAATDARPIAFGVARGAKDLLKFVNAFIFESALNKSGDDSRFDDLEGMRKRRVLRVLTRNNSYSYFLHRGRRFGFEYELVKHLADSLGLRLAMIVVPTRGDLIPWLLEGKGDLIAAGLTITEKRQKSIAFSHPYFMVQKKIVAPAGGREFESVEDMAGKTFHVRRSSSYYGMLSGLRAEGVDLSIGLVPEDVETGEIIDRVARGEYAYTLAASNIVDMELTYRDDIMVAWTFSEEKALGWGMRPDNPKLKEAVDGFVKEEYRGLAYNTIRKRYFEENKRMRGIRNDAYRTDLTGSISIYDDLMKKYADQYRLDWRLIAAQAYEESRFDPEAVSWAGAMGLLQVMPRTAREMGIDITTEEGSIHCGVKYLRHLIDRFPASIPLGERIYFGLAAYNIGWGHVYDARRLARMSGLDRDKWFGSVEKAMFQLRKPEVAGNTRHGWCRGGQAVAYVRSIQARYESYIQHVEY